jgi:prophage antirepressor-like protein|nr:MAG TPA: repressor domain protein [Caudoviricetes sp.]
MNELMIFTNPEFGNIRTIECDGAPWFVGKDVAEALGYAKPRNAIDTHVDPDDALKQGVTDSMGRTQEMTIINESGLYALVLGSKLPTAKKFKRWVTSEVIPSIRKSGGYIKGQENMTPQELMAAALLMAQKTIEARDVRIAALTVENQIMAPKADYFDDLVDRNLLTNFRETAKEIGAPPKKFVEFLLGKKYIYRDKKGKILPCEAKNDGLFEVKECLNEKTKWSGVQTLITPKGRETFRLLFVGVT